MPAATCALVVPSDLESQALAGMDSLRSVLVDVEVAGPSPCMEPRDSFLDLKTFLKMRFIVSSMIVKVEDR